jgi:preprotein translocase subunit SecD
VAPPSKRPSRPGGSASRPGGASRQSGPTSRPWRYLAGLAVLLIVMLATIIGGAALHPGSWHDKFKVGLGLDLSSGTTVTIKTVVLGPGNRTPTSADMAQSIAILNSRVNGQGFTGAKIQQQGTDEIVVSVPHRSAEDIAPLLSSAVLRFRQVLLVAPGRPTALAPPASASPSPSPSPGTSSASPKAGAGASSSPSPSASASKSGGTGQAAGAKAISGSSSPTPSSSPNASGSASPSPSGSASPSPSPSASPTVRLPTAADASGDISKVTSKAVIADFNRLNCTNKRWQSEIYGNDPTKWDNASAQIVACDSQGNKYVLDVAKVLGSNLTKVAAQLNPQSQWVVNFNLNGQGGKAFGDLTTQMYQKYYSTATQNETSPLDQFAIVLDGKVVSAPIVNQPIPNGNGEITGPGGSFTHAQATSLTNVLKYGAVPLAFQRLQTQSISPQLGASQLTAGLVAAAIGLLLVVIYSFLYYRGLAFVSVLSLATAALITWLSVIMLSKYQGYTLSLAGVAGLIVAIGITADSFVVYFERLRDEVREGRSLRAAVERGWHRARRTILVSDTVSFLAALLLYIIAIGDVRGFAFTLGLTTLIDIVVVFLFTKPMVSLLARTEFFGRGHKWSGLDPARLGAKSPWRGSRAATARPAAGTASATSATAARTTPKEA